MCDVATYAMIEEICDEWTREGRLFTAYDVSREARQRGTWERHRHMKNAVHSLHQSGGLGRRYTRTLVRIPGAPASAWLYHRVDVPSSFYPPLRRAGSPLWTTVLDLFGLA
jgi:hypothetical protein